MKSFLNHVLDVSKFNAIAGQVDCAVTAKAIEYHAQLFVGSCLTSHGDVAKKGTREEYQIVDF